MKNALRVALVLLAVAGVNELLLAKLPDHLLARLDQSSVRAPQPATTWPSPATKAQLATVTRRTKTGFACADGGQTPGEIALIGKVVSFSTHNLRAQFAAAEMSRRSSRQIEPALSCFPNAQSSTLNAPSFHERIPMAPRPRLPARYRRLHRHAQRVHRRRSRRLRRGPGLTKVLSNRPSIRSRARHSETNPRPARWVIRTMNVRPQTFLTPRTQRAQRFPS